MEDINKKKIKVYKSIALQILKRVNKEHTCKISTVDY